ncbi:hypothetical protein Hanom_Chr11g01052131 [Helianthus anomalus]
MYKSFKHHKHSLSTCTLSLKKRARVISPDLGFHHSFISKHIAAPLLLSLSRDFTRSMKFQQIDADSDLLVPISGFYWLYFIRNFSSLSSSFLRRAISIFKRLLIGLLRFDD